MIDQVHNETLKLLASWCNGVSIAVAVGGIALPLINYAIDRLNYVWTDAWLFVICGCASVVLHLIGQSFLGGLQSE